VKIVKKRCYRRMIQLSVFLPNRPGEFSKFLDVFIENDIEILGITVAESDEYGLLLLLVDKPQECINVLDESGYGVSATEVIAVKIDSDSNTKSMKKIAKVLGDNNINIEYLYSSLYKEVLYLILKVNDIEGGKKVLKESGFEVEEDKI